MQGLIIVAHPHPTGSHTRHAFEHAIQLLDETKADYEVIDLYADGFDPVMRDKPTKKHLTQLDRYRSLIDGADAILICYPVWWNGPPAILKGFFDCILTQGWAYHYYMTPIPKIGLPIGHLKGKRAAIVSTSGALNFLHFFIQGSRAGVVIAHDVLSFVGMKTRRFNIGGCQVYDESSARRIEGKVRGALRWLRLL